MRFSGLGYSPSIRLMHLGSATCSRVDGKSSKAHGKKDDRPVGRTGRCRRWPATVRLCQRWILPRYDQMSTALPDHRPCRMIAESATPTLARPHPAAMAVNRAVSSHLDCVGLPGLTFRTRRSCGRVGGSTTPWWPGTPGASPRATPPGGWNEGYEPAVLWGGGSADCPGLPRPTWKGDPGAIGPAWLGTRRAADVLERTEDMRTRLLCAPRRIHLAIGRVCRGLAADIHLP